MLLLKTVSYLLEQTSLAAEGLSGNHKNVDFLRKSADDLEDVEYSVECLKSQEKLFANRAKFYCHRIHAEVKRLTANKVNALEHLHQTLVKKTCEAYFEYYCFQSYLEFVSKLPSGSTQRVFSDLLRLFVANRIDREAEYFRPILKEKYDETRDVITNLCKSLRKDIIPLTDCLPFHDKFLGAWGGKDLNGYKEFLRLVKSVPGAETRLKTWRKLPNTNNS